MSRARDLSKLVNPAVFSVSTDNNVGVNSTTPVEKLNVVGVVSATAFYGDGSQLEGVASAGLGTAVVDDSPYGGEQIYYTNKELRISGNLTVDVPDSAEVAYTQYQEIVVDSGADFIVGDGDDFIPDILGIGTEVQQPGLLAGAGGRVRADNFSDKSGTGAPTFSSGVVVTGVATATSFSGNADTATYASVAGIATNAEGLTGTPNIIVGSVSGTTGSFTGNVSIGGTLTYEDVTNIDSVGIITARSGLRVLSGLSILSGGLVEKFENAGTTLGSQTNNPIYDGNVILFTGNESGNNTINFTGIHTNISSGENISFTVVLTPNNSGGISTVQIDGSAQTIQWSGGSVPSAGSSGRDVYAFTILKTGSGATDYVVLGAANNFA